MVKVLLWNLVMREHLNWSQSLQFWWLVFGQSPLDGKKFIVHLVVRNQLKLQNHSRRRTNNSKYRIWLKQAAVDHVEDDDCKHVPEEDHSLNRWRLTARFKGRIYLNLSFYVTSAVMGNMLVAKKAMMKWIGINSRGVCWKLIPYLWRLSKMLRMFKTKNITPAKLMKPRNLCVGDYPLRIEMWVTLLGTKARQLLYLLCLFIASASSWMAPFDDLIVASLIIYFLPSVSAGGMRYIVSYLGLSLDYYSFDLFRSAIRVLILQSGFSWSSRNEI